ncbi:hypothetical protein KKC52_13960, partial [bacterium]|nr:hypothetical protein [bacterium]
YVAATREGGQPIHLWLEDEAGNIDQNNRSSGMLYYDGAPPGNPVSCAELGGAKDGVWQKEIDNPGFTWKEAEDGHSGVHGYYYYWGQDPNGTAENYTAESKYDPPPASSGTYYLRIRTKDKAGNKAPWVTIFTFKFDGTPPENSTTCIEFGGAQNGGWQKDINDPNFILSGAEDAHSGLAGYYYYFGQDPDGASDSYTTETKYDPPAVGSGTYYLRVRTKDKAGNSSDWKTVFAFKFDETPPENPLFCTEPSGAQDNIWQKDISDPNFGWSGADDAHSGVHGYYHYFGRDPNGTSKDYTAKSGYNPQAVGSGTYYLRIKTKDKAGNSSDWKAAFTFRFDDGAPTITIDYPLSNHWYGEPVANYYGKASDAISGLALSTLEYNYNNQGWKPFKDDAGAHDWDDSDEIPEIKEEATLQIRVKDVAGNLAASAVATVKVDLGALPVRDLASLTHPDSSKWYPNSNPEFNWNAPADESGIEGYSYLFDRTEGTLPDEKIDTTDNSVAFTDTEDGIWYFHVRAKDKADPPHWSKTAHLKIRIDTTPPEVLTIDYPVSDKWYQEKIAGYYGQAKDAGSGIDLSTLQFSYDGSPWTKFIDDTGGVHDWDDTDKIPRPETTKKTTLQIRIKDVAGNLAVSKVTVIKVDPKALSPQDLTSPTHPDPAKWEANNSPEFNWKSPADISGIEGYSYALDRKEGTVPDEKIDTTDNGIAFTGTEDGIWHFHVRAKDRAGNWSEPVHYQVRIDISPPPAPEITCATHSEEKWVSNNAPAFSWTVSDRSEITGYSYVLDKTAATIVNDTSEGTGTIRSYANLPDGDYWFHVKARSRAGMWGKTSHYKIMVDTTPPETVALDYPLSNHWYGKPVTAYHGRVSDSTSGIDLATLEYNYNNQGWKPFKDDAGPNDWDDSDEIPQTKGEATLQIRVKDKAGNLAASAVATVKVDLGALPVRDIASLTHPDSTKWYPDNNPEFNWKAPVDESGIEGYSYLLDRKEDTIPDEKINTAGTTISFTDTEDGIRYFHVRAKDKADPPNWSDPVHLKIRVDATPPEVLTIDYPVSDKWYPEKIAGYYGRMSDSGSGVNLSTLEYSYKGGPWTKFSVGPGGAHDWDDRDEIPHTTEGTETTLQIRVEDMTGNLAASAVTTIKVDLGALPVRDLVSLTHPDPTKWYPASNPEFNWNAPADESGIEGYSYLFDRTEGTIPDEKIDTTDNSIAFTDTEDGIWYFHIRAKDRSGNWGEPIHYQVRIDVSSPPAPEVTSPAHPKDRWAGNNEPAFNWTAFDPSGITGYSFILDQATTTTVDDISEGTTTTGSSTGLKDGIYWFHIKARDGAGAWGETSHYKIKIDTTGPENLSIDYPLSNYWHKEPVTNYYGKASDAVSGIDPSTLEYNYNNQGFKPFKDDAGAHDWDDSDEIPRTKEEATLQIRVKDMAGNPAVSAVMTIKVDLGTLPVQDIASLTHPDSTKWYPDNNPEFSWKSPADESGIEGYSYLFDRTEGTIPDEKIDTTDNRVAFTDTEDGIWYFHLRSKDMAGNWSEPVHLKIRIDTTPPELPIIDYPQSNKWHRENITKYSGRLSDSESGVNLSTLEYSYNGGEWTKFNSDSNLPAWNDQDEIPHTFRTEGTTLQIRAKDMAGNLSRSGVTIIRVQGFKIDTKLLTRLVLDEGEFTTDGTRLICSFSEMPKAEEYQYCLGTTPGERDVIGWTSVGRKREVEVTGLDLKEGETYYFAVRARKKKFLVLESFFDLGISDGITFDVTGPDKPLVIDDGDQVSNSNKLHFAWSSSDKTSGVRDYLYALGTTPQGTDLLNWRFGGADQELLLTDLSLENQKTYYLSVKAIDKAGNESLIGVSDGITVADLTPPVVISIQDEGEWTTDGTQLSFSFKAEDEESEVVEYQYAIGTSPKSDDLTGWKKTIRTEVTEKDLRLSNGQSYYLTIKAGNKSGLWSEPKSSDGIIVDVTPPLISSSPSDEGKYSKETTLKFNWPSASDPETGVESYLLCVGTTSELCDLFDEEVGDVLTKEIAPAKQAKTYYARIRAKNKAGLLSKYSPVSDGITIDLTPPSVPIVRDDGETTKDAASLHAVWSCQDDESGIVEYQYA